MKKLAILFAIVALLIPSFAGACYEVVASESEANSLCANDLDTEFTHTVFAEYGTTVACPYCPTASDALYEIYNSSDYPFYYVSLVASENSVAAERMSNYHATYVPVVYFDGGYKSISGSEGSLEDNEVVYRSIIENCGNRIMFHPLDVDMNVIWEGNATITVEINIRNDGNFFYFGHLRAYVAEITSRWNNYDGNPYHFGFLDYAFNRFIFIRRGGTYTASVTWDGSEQHGDQTFEDISKNNTMVIASVSHWRPHLKKNNWNTPLTSILYLGYYNDQTCAAIPS